MTDERASSEPYGVWRAKGVGPDRFRTPERSVRTRRVTVRPSPHVYTRRRIMVAVLLTAVVLAGWFALRELGSLVAFPAPEVSQPVTGIGAPRYVAQSGDTYWAIARRLDPDGDPRPVVDRLVAANGGNSLQAGDVVVVPAIAD